MASKPRSAPPRAMVEKVKGGRLAPVGPYDAAVLDQARLGAVYDLVPRRKRSNPQLGLYWLALQAVVDGTGAWPDAEALHSVLVFECGFVRPVMHLDGTVVVERDSVAFDAMEPERFNLYMDMALTKLGEALGIDVFALLPPDVRRNP